MKKYYFSGFLLAGMALLLCSACKKFLDKKPDQSLAVPVTLQEAQYLMNYYTSMNAQTPNMGMESDDDFYMTDAYFDTEIADTRATYLWQKEARNEAAWESMYNVVLNANLALEIVEGVAPTISNKAERDKTRGYALVHRANAFYFLAQYYATPFIGATAASVPGIPLRKASDLNTPTVRQSLAETYQQILSDLKAAVPLLPTLTNPISLPSKASAYALLARVELTMQHYEAAGSYADSALQINNTLIDYNSLSTTATVPFAQFNAEVIYPMSLAGAARFYQNNLLVDSALYQSYQTNDLRKQLFFKNLAPIPAYGFKGNYEGNTYGVFFTGIATDEMYLVKAESQARAGQIAEAMSSLNALLIKRWKTGAFVPFTAVTAAQALRIVLEERRKELVGRGLRWLDLRRYNLEPSTAVTIRRKVKGVLYELPPNHPNYTFYIPQIVIDMAGIAQNTRQ